VQNHHHHHHQRPRDATFAKLWRVPSSQQQLLQRQRRLLQLLPRLVSFSQPRPWLLLLAPQPSPVRLLLTCHAWVLVLGRGKILYFWGYDSKNDDELRQVFDFAVQQASKSGNGSSDNKVLLDTAEIYGFGRSETLIGEFAKSYPEDKIQVSLHKSSYNYISLLLLR
jgi:hypothetical protein